MNELKTELNDKVENYIVNHINLLYLAYGQDVDITTIEKVSSLIISELLKRSELNKKHLDGAYNEILKNYTTYRKMCAASYLTAFYKVNKK